MLHKRMLMTALSALWVACACYAQALPAGVKTKVEAKAKQLSAWSTDPAIVNAVKAYNANPPAEAKDMTNEKWKNLSVLDPAVRSFSHNALGTYLKGRKDETVAEIFVSGAKGTKVAFLSKTTSWSHADKDKHKVPMSGRTYYGPIELDASTGVQQVQIGLPVLDGGKPIGSIVVGLSVIKLK